MRFSGNKFYIIWILLWLFGIYFAFTKFHATLTNDQVLEERIVYLQNEVKLLEEQLSQIQLEK